MSHQFNNWIDTFLSEKGIDLETGFIVEKEDSIFGDNHMTIGNVVNAMKATGPSEQQAIKNNFVKIDFMNGDVTGYIKHLAQAIAV